MRKTKKRKGFYRRIAEVIVAGSPFDLMKHNGEGWTKVQELIALYMLKDLPEADKYRLFDGYLDKVNALFDKAVDYINKNPDNDPLLGRYHVYKYIPVGARNIQFLSVQVSYRSAKDKNTDRLIRRIATVIRPAISEIQKTDPQRLIEARNSIKLLPAGVSF